MAEKKKERNLTFFGLSSASPSPPPLSLNLLLEEQ